MAVNTTRITIGADAWTDVGGGQPFVTVFTEETRVTYLHIGQEAPPIDTPHRFALPSGFENAANLSLGVGDKVFALSGEGSVHVIVLAGST